MLQCDLPALELEAETERGMADTREEELSNNELFVFSHEEFSDSDERQLISLADLLPLVKRMLAVINMQKMES